MRSVPEIRIVNCNSQPIVETGEFVLYWMTAFRRVSWNFALQRASERAHELGKGLLILEAIPLDYPWACERFHRFILDGVQDNAKQTSLTAAAYYPLVEKKPGQAEELLLKLSQSAAVVVTDDFPSPDHQKRIESAATRISVTLEKVDSNGLLPLHSTDKVFARAFDFRRYLQQMLPRYLQEFPVQNPLPGKDELPRPYLPDEVSISLSGGDVSLSRLQIDHRVVPTQISGGTAAASRTLQFFLAEKLQLYSTARSHPGKDATSGLSPYLHFVHISAHQVFVALMCQEDWSPSRLSARAGGQKSSWWNTGRDAEAFLDELITWRELGFNMASNQSDYDQYSSLPEWAKQTLSEHSSDPRPETYELDQFEQAQTHDPLWNAAQRELVGQGRIHNYLRMLWGKKILEWSRSPEEALEIMVELNNKYALDGSDPNSYSGIFWVLGRYDRPWGPERPIFGKIRYMSTHNTVRKFDLKPYMKKYGSGRIPR